MADKGIIFGNSNKRLFEITALIWHCNHSVLPPCLESTVVSKTGQRVGKTVCQASHKALHLRRLVVSSQLAETVKREVSDPGCSVHASTGSIDPFLICLQYYGPPRMNALVSLVWAKIEKLLINGRLLPNSTDRTAVRKIMKSHLREANGQFNCVSSNPL